MRSTWIATLVMIGMAGVGGGPAAAQDAALEELAYAYGTVVERTGDQLVVSEFDEATGLMTTQTYTIAPDVELYDAETIEDIAVGDELDLDYILQSGARIATAIAVGKFVEEDRVEEDLEHP